jgi:hypothetical protein
MDHPDFRVRNKIFASLWSDGMTAMVKLSRAEQRDFIDREPKVYEPASGAWGRQGCTTVALEKAKLPSVKRALAAAWRNTAPKSLTQK